MLNRHLVLSTLIIGLLVGMIGSIYDPNIIVFAQQEEQKRKAQWEEYRNALATVDTMDRELKHVNDKFNEIKTNMKEINQKIDRISDDIMGVKIKAAESGGIYGGLASVVVYFVGLLIRGLWIKRKNGK